MQLQFLGATGTVTGSKYLLSSGRTKILVDAGLFQGYKQLRLRNWTRLPVPASRLQSVVLTHAHLDHSGYLPLLVKNGFHGKIFCSEATYELCKLLLPDSGRLHEEEAGYANRHGFSRHSPALPLYTEEDAVRSLKYFSPTSFGNRFHIAGTLHGTLSRSGHILGAASVMVDDGSKKICFSGDLGRPDDPVMFPPEGIERTDYLVVESTYGNRRHEQNDPMEYLGNVIRSTAARGGVVVIPAFAVGRVQTMLYYLHKLKESGAIPPLLPIYVDSPMAVDATALYLKHRKDHRISDEQCNAIRHAAHMVNSVEESKSLMLQRIPMVIIAASGMATGGRVLHHLKAYAPDPRNTILFAGYQAGGTRGAALVGGAEAIKIHGNYVPVRAQVEQLENLSAHADGDQIVQWLSQLKSPPRRTFITHGEPVAADALRLRIEEQLRWHCTVPEYMEIVELT